MPHRRLWPRYRVRCRRSSSVFDNGKPLLEGERVFSRPYRTHPLPGQWFLTMAVQIRLMMQRDRVVGDQPKAKLPGRQSTRFCLALVVGLAKQPVPLESSHDGIGCRRDPANAPSHKGVCASSLDRAASLGVACGPTSATWAAPRMRTTTRSRSAEPLGHDHHLVERCEAADLRAEVRADRR